MNELSKNNFIYYKVQLSKLVKQAKKNGLEVYLQERHRGDHLYDHRQDRGEIRCFT